MQNVFDNKVLSKTCALKNVKSCFPNLPMPSASQKLVHPFFFASAVLLAKQYALFQIKIKNSLRHQHANKGTGKTIGWRAAGEPVHLYL